MAGKMTNAIWVPEGGSDLSTNSGFQRLVAEWYHQGLYKEQYLVLASGTGGTISGILPHLRDGQRVLVFNAVPGFPVNEKISEVCRKDLSRIRFELVETSGLGKFGKVAEDLIDFETRALEAAGVAMESVPPRYRSTYFSHIIGGYSAGYYSYIWSEVLDADTVEWFRENGGMKRENGDHFRRTLLSRGGAEDAMTLFENFRGAPPDIQPLLERRGLEQPLAE
jgi:hypothetical protein